MNETVLAIFIVFPSLIVIIAYSVKDWFIENYDPYAQLSDINCFNSLRNNNGNGFKRFLAAVKYEHFRRKLLFIIDGRNLTIWFGFYIIGIFNVLVLVGFKIIIINVVIATLPNIIACVLVIIGFQIKNLKKQIGG